MKVRTFQEKEKLPRTNWTLRRGPLFKKVDFSPAEQDFIDANNVQPLRQVSNSSLRNAKTFPAKLP